MSASALMGTDEIARHLDQAPIGFALVRQDGRISYVNETLARWVHMNASELTATATFKSVLAAPSRIYFETHIAPLLAATGEVTEIAVDLAGRDGTRVPVLLSAQVDRSRAEPALTRIAVQRVEERRRYETEILNERRRAEHALAELKRAQSRIIELSQASAMGTLSSSLAHELNQPLTIVTNMLGGLKRLLADGRASPLIDEVIGDAEGAARQATEIIRRMRAVMEGRHALPTAVRLSDVIEAAIEAAVNRTERGDTLFRVDVNPPELVVRGNEEQLGYVITVVVTNAIEATSSNRPAEVAIAAAEVEGEVIEVRVIDRGGGVDAAVQQSLFKAFATTKPGRRGLSLANARTIVEAHGGRIRAASTEQNLGTTFTITLPIYH